jgi:site-specific recombinase XerD
MGQTPTELAVLLEESWVTALRSERKSPNTVDLYREGVRQFLRWCERTGTPAELTKPAAQAFLADLLQSGAQPMTARARYQALKRFSIWLASEGERDTDALIGLQQPKLDAKVINPLSVDELRALLKACRGVEFRDRRDEAIIRLMAETGIRASECVGLRVEDVDIGRSTAIIRRGKGGAGRVVAFTPQTAAAIDRYKRARRSHRRADAPELWLGGPVKAFSYTGLYHALTWRAELAGISRFHPHLLRHTAATRWLAAGGSEGGLMAQAGWKKREMLDRYVAATASERAADEARRLGLGDL